jgi:hypothetical protein
MVPSPLIGEIEMTEQAKSSPEDMVQQESAKVVAATEKEIAAAQKLGSEIVAVAKTTQSNLDVGVASLRFLIAQAKDTEKNPHFLRVAVVDHSFADWKGYVDYVMAEVPNLHAALRAEFAKVLHAEKMTIREIADTLGTAKSQIARDVAGVSQRATSRVEKEAATARGEVSTPSPRGTSNVTSRAVSALEKCAKAEKKDAENVYPLRSEKVTDQNLTEFKAMLAQISQDVDVEIDRRRTDREFAAIIAEVQANPGQYKDAIEKAKAKANHPAGRVANGNNPRTGSAAA